MLGRLLSYWVSVTFQGRAVKLREGNFYKWPKINGFQWVLFHELYVCPYWRLSSWPLVICFFGPACRKLFTKHFRYHLMEESSNSMSCMAYGYGKTQPKNGRKEGKTQDFAWANYGNLSLGHPKRWLSKGFFPEKPQSAAFTRWALSRLINGVICNSY